MELLVVLSVYTVLVLTDFMAVIHKKQKTVIWVYSIILAVTFTVLVLKSLDVNIPAPYISIKKAVEQYLNR